MLEYFSIFRMLMKWDVCSSSSTSEFSKSNNSSNIFKRYTYKNICLAKEEWEEEKVEGRGYSKLSFSSSSFIFFSSFSETSIYIINFRWVDLLSFQNNAFNRICLKANSSINNIRPTYFQEIDRKEMYTHAQHWSR